MYVPMFNVFFVFLNGVCMMDILMFAQKQISWNGFVLINFFL
jgi:hypothetical protein